MELFDDGADGDKEEGESCCEEWPPCHSCIFFARTVAGKECDGDVEETDMEIWAGQTFLSVYQARYLVESPKGGEFAARTFAPGLSIIVVQWFWS